MKKAQLKIKFIETHEAFIQDIDALSEAEFLFSLNNEKWNAGQQMNHIGISLGVLKNGMSLPKLALKMKFGTTKEATKSYDEFVKNYIAKIDKIKNPHKVEGSKFDPDPISFDAKAEAIERFRSTMNKMIAAYEKFSESDSEKYVLPHPLIGNMSMKEWMYFDIMHVQHHHKRIKEYLASFQD